VKYFEVQHDVKNGVVHVQGAADAVADPAGEVFVTPDEEFFGMHELVLRRRRPRVEDSSVVASPV